MITGYSRSGKTTLLNHWSGKYGTEVLSTSNYLTIKTLEYFGFPTTPEWVGAVHKKEVDCPLEFDFFNKVGMSFRDAKIYVAEEQIVPHLGRKEGLVRPVVKGRKETSDLLLCEVFNHEEMMAWSEVLKEEIGNIMLHRMALRRKEELTGVDGRELIGKEFWSTTSTNLLIGEIKTHFGIL